jgi:hypothetical protein
LALRIGGTLQAMASIATRSVPPSQRLGNSAASASRRIAGISGIRHDTEIKELFRPDAIRRALQAGAIQRAIVRARAAARRGVRHQCYARFPASDYAKPTLARHLGGVRQKSARRQSHYPAPLRASSLPPL